MSDLITTPPSATHYRAAWGLYTECYTFYFLPAGFKDVVEVPFGWYFGVVYSPTNYASPGFRDDWCYVRFRPDHQKFVDRDTELSRCYVQVKDGKRSLTEAERIHFEGLVAAHKQPMPEAIPA